MCTIDLTSIALDRGKGPITILFRHESKKTVHESHPRICQTGVLMQGQRGDAKGDWDNQGPQPAI